MIMILESLLALVLLYTLIKVIRRRLCKPDYRGKNVWITGASSGIGEYLTYEFSRCGASLIISARNQEQLEHVKNNCANKDKVQVVRLDMSDYQSVRKVTAEVLAKIQEKGEKLDVVIENAGVSMRCQFKDYDFKNHLSMFNVNVNGPYLHMQCILPHMIQNKSGQIVGITSVQGKLATAYRTSYAGSKHALIAILDSMRSELHGHGIKVTNIMPGYVQTNISKNAFGSGAGEKFGETDDNIKKGMSVEEFSAITVKAIYMQENEAQISNQPIVPLGIALRNICPDLAFFGLRMNKKNQTAAINKAK